MRPLGQQKAVNRERDPANDPHGKIQVVDPIEWRYKKLRLHHGRAHMVDQHCDAGNDFQRFLRKTGFFHTALPFAVCGVTLFPPL